MNKGDRLAAVALSRRRRRCLRLKTNIAAVTRVDARQHFDQRDLRRRFRPMPEPRPALPAGDVVDRHVAANRLTMAEGKDGLCRIIHSHVMPLVLRPSEDANKLAKSLVSTGL